MFEMKIIAAKRDFQLAPERTVFLNSGLSMGWLRVPGLSPASPHGIEIPVPPDLPKPPHAPWITIQTATFGDDWRQLLRVKKHDDVSFVVDGHRVFAHKVALGVWTIVSDFSIRLVVCDGL
jgi:hypothetical protein